MHIRLGMKQLSFISKTNERRECGGSVSIGKRKSQRPLSIKKPIHLVLKSDFATGPRSLLRHRSLIEKIIKKAQKRFFVRVYEFAVVSNHIHLLVKCQTRVNLQNFFRVVAGHIAQEILRRFPLSEWELQERGGALGKRENKFWISRIYSRVVTWGREFANVKHYVVQNTLEALKLIAYKPRKTPPIKLRLLS